MAPTLAPGQKKQILREIYNDNVLCPFPWGICQEAGQLEGIVKAVRGRFPTHDPVFWFRPEANCRWGESLYFIGSNDITLVETPTYDWRSKGGQPRIERQPDTVAIAQIMALKDNKRDLAFAKGLITLQHPKLATRLSEYLAAYPTWKDMEDVRFPDVMCTGAVDHETLYGRKLYTGIDLFAEFVGAVSGRDMHH